MTDVTPAASQPLLEERSEEMTSAKKTMNRADASKLAIKLAKDGFTNGDIAKELAKAGYLSRKTGKPLGGSAISGLTTHMVRRRAPNGHAAATKRPAKRAKLQDKRLEAIRQILNLEMDPTERIALAMLVIQ